MNQDRMNELAETIEALIQDGAQTVGEVLDALPPWIRDEARLVMILQGMVG